ncbi:photosynthetic reaction center cytochrome c subunit [bacterium]|nr:photosynthetic reaction center cytochrome c subunit [bacterium]
MRAKRHLLVVLPLLLALVAIARAGDGRRSLKFFPRDIDERDLRCKMNVMRRSLGVKSCAHCHQTEPRDMSVDTDNKITARHMLAMTAEINSALSARDTSQTTRRSPRVDCFTCHRGEEMPESRPEKPERERKFREAVRAEKYRSGVAAGERLVEKLNREYFSSPDSTKVSCWTCHRGELELSAVSVGDAYADFK